MTHAKPGMKLEIVSGDDFGITLNDVQAFIDHVQRVAPDLMESKIWTAAYTEGLKATYRLQVEGEIPAASDGPFQGVNYLAQARNAQGGDVAVEIAVPEPADGGC
jgi:hypothetical protein